MDINTSSVGEGSSVAKASEGKADGSIRDAARQFEALFMEQLIRQMRDAQLGDGFFGKGAGSKIYEGMFSSFMAEHLAADSPLGIARLLEERWTGDSAGKQQAAEALSAAETEHAARAYQVAAMNPETAGQGREMARSLKSPGIGSNYGWRQDPIDGRRAFHEGVDLPAREGTPVLAVAPGRVASAETKPGYGLSVVIEHAGGWTTRYAHLSATDAKPGQPIGRGQTLGRVGSTGRSTGPHLHFEALHQGRRVDPSLAAPGELRPQVLGRNADENHDGTGTEPHEKER